MVVVIWVQMPVVVLMEIDVSPRGVRHKTVVAMREPKDDFEYRIGSRTFRSKPAESRFRRNLLALPRLSALLSELRLG